MKDIQIFNLIYDQFPNKYRIAIYKMILSKTITYEPFGIAFGSMIQDWYYFFINPILG